MWDLALVQALIHPEMAETIEITTPAENVQRKVTLFKKIDQQKMAADYWASLKK